MESSSDDVRIPAAAVWIDRRVGQLQMQEVADMRRKRMWPPPALARSRGGIQPFRLPPAPSSSPLLRFAVHRWPDVFERVRDPRQALGVSDE